MSFMADERPSWVGPALGAVRILVVVVTAACSRRTAPVGDLAAVPTEPRRAAAASAWLPAYDFGPPAALRVVGYPRALDAVAGGRRHDDRERSDPASAFGWTRAGTFAACAFDVCCREGVSECMFAEHGGTTTRRSTIASQGVAIVSEKRVLEDFVRDEHLLRTETPGGVDRPPIPPPASGTWKFGRDITLHAVEVGPSERAGASGPEIVAPATVRLGGAMEGEAPVWVWTPETDPFCLRFPDGCARAQINGLSLSPDGEELGIVVYELRPAHGASRTVHRIGVAKLASRIYNAIGYRHHVDGDDERAAGLFAAALRAMPANDVAAYNLACAWARRGDPRAEAALQLAIDGGGAEVVARARTDRDFDAARHAGWFRVLVP